MKFSRMIHAVDVWAAGGPHRIVIGGLPPIKGRTMHEKRDFIRKHFPAMPRALTAAPDDPSAMVAAVLTEPCDDRADFGVIWMGCSDFMNLCGTGTFAIGTVLCEMGMVKTGSNQTVNVVLEIPTGLQQLKIHMQGDTVSKVSTRTSPSYFQGDYRIQVPGHGEVSIEVAYGINCLEPLIDCDRLGIALVEKNRLRLAELSQKIGLAVRESSQLNAGQKSGVQLSFYQDNPADSAADYRCMAIVGNGEVDITPSGTSTCAQLATRLAKGRISVGQEITVESITGATLSGRVVEETEFDGHKAVIPELSGSGRIIRLQNIIF